MNAKLRNPLSIAGLLPLLLPAISFAQSNPVDRPLKLSEPLYFESTAPGAELETVTENDRRAPGASIGLRLAYFTDTDTAAIRGDILPGVAIRGHFLNWLSAELLVAWSHFNDPNFTRDVIPLQVSALIYPPLAISFIPYLAAGVGWYLIHTDSDIDALDDDDSEFGYHLGAGIDWFLSDKVSLSIDWRYIWLDSDSAAVPGLGDDELWMLSFGFNFHF